MILKTLSNYFFIYLLYNPKGDMVTLFHKCMHIFLYIVSFTSVVY